MDELRDRIAAVVSDHYIEDEGVNWWQCICGQKFYIPQGSYRACEEHVADAVVTEIGLREEMKYPGGTFSFTPPQRRRYVTDWVTDE